MSATAAIRSSSSSTSLIASTTQAHSSSPTTTPSAATATATSTLPKLSSTPQKQPSSAKAATSTPTSTPTQSSTPGRWKHPRMDEIIRRQNRTKFGQENVVSIIYNLVFLLSTFFINPLLNGVGLSIPYTFVILFQALFALMAALPLAPLFRKTDPCEDIPLTPSQRQLLGLPPASRPATPQEKEQWVTPPRYQQRTPHGSSGGSRGGSGTLGGATMSGVPSAWRSASGSPVPSPTVYNNGGIARERGSGAERRKLSYTAASNRSSPLNFSDFDGGASLGVSVGGVGAGTPTRSNNLPSQRTSASVGLNSKWLYERQGRVYS